MTNNYLEKKSSLWQKKLSWDENRQLDVRTPLKNSESSLRLRHLSKFLAEYSYSLNDSNKDIPKSYRKNKKEDTNYAK